MTFNSIKFNKILLIYKTFTLQIGIIELGLSIKTIVHTTDKRTQKDGELMKLEEALALPY